MTKKREMWENGSKPSVWDPSILVRVPRDFNNVVEDTAVWISHTRHYRLLVLLLLLSIRYSPNFSSSSYCLKAYILEDPHFKLTIRFSKTESVYLCRRLLFVSLFVSINSLWLWCCSFPLSFHLIWFMTQLGRTYWQLIPHALQYIWSLVEKTRRRSERQTRRKLWLLLY